MCYWLAPMPESVVHAWDMWLYVFLSCPKCQSCWSNLLWAKQLLGCSVAATCTPSKAHCKRRIPSASFVMLLSTVSTACLQGPITPTFQPLHGTRTLNAPMLTVTR